MPDPLKVTVPIRSVNTPAPVSDQPAVVTGKVLVKETSSVPWVRVSVFESAEIKEDKKKIVLSPKSKKDKEISLRQIRRMTNSVRALLIKGVERVKRAVVIKEGGEVFIRAAGSNILGILSHPAVDRKRIYTNDIKKIEEVYGIEAARNAILTEVKRVLDSQKLFVDIRHIMLVADALCAEGIVSSVGRHGLSGHKAGVLGRAAFEETVKHIVNASLKGDEDRLAGVTENIIIGQTVPVGTGKIMLQVNMPRKKAKKEEKKEEDDEKKEKKPKKVKDKD